ncbi:MAG: flippase-like domain-containing protein [Candidatus Melainabacteria bacterium]|nr:flippase-like domain-containing protein [Candidatus Melainabacteria bacterium]
MRKNIFLYVKLILLIVIFAWIFKVVNVNETIKVLQKTNLFFFLLAFIINNLSSIFLTIKWHRLASPLEIKSDFTELLKLNYISIFYSTFIPGQASGELIKGIKLSKKEKAVQKVWIPIFIDKITNLFMVFVIGFIATLSDKTFRQNTGLILVISLLTILLFFTTIILFSENTEKIVSILKDFILRSLRTFNLNTKSIEEFSITYFKEYKKHDLLMLETFFWSLLIKAPHIFAFYFLSLSLNIDLNLIQNAWLFATVSLATILPISFAGLGVREGIVVAILSKIGISSSSALSLSLLIFLLGILAALIGGIIELLSDFKQKTINE